MSNIVLDDKDFRDLIAGRVVRKPMLDKTVRILLKDIGYETMHKALIAQMYEAGASVEKLDSPIPSQTGSSYIEKCACGKPFMKNTGFTFPSVCDICEDKKKRNLSNQSKHE